MAARIIRATVVLRAFPGSVNNPVFHVIRADTVIVTTHAGIVVRFSSLERLHMANPLAGMLRHRRVLNDQ
jgi:hypothetical protein